MESATPIKLRWNRRETENPVQLRGVFDAETPIGTYTVGRNGFGEFVWFTRGRSDRGNGKALTLELAKLDAECDFIRRVMACINTGGTNRANSQNVETALETPRRDR